MFKRLIIATVITLVSSMGWGATINLTATGGSGPLYSDFLQIKALVNGYDDGILGTIGSGSSVAEDVTVTEIGTATYDDVQDWINNTQSAGIVSGGIITDGGSGTIDISAAKGFIKTTNSDIGVSTSFDLAASSGVALTDESINYISVDYNSGTPQFIVGVTNTSNGTTIFNLGKVFREGTGVDIINSGLNCYNFQKRVQQHHVETGAIQFVSGAVVSETGTRSIAITSGVMYAGINRITTTAIDTNVADDFEYYYYDGDAGPAVWIESDETQIDNLQYNAVGTGLATLANNRYGVHWVYKGTGTKAYVLYGQDSYTLSGAQSAQPPSSLPSHVENMGVLRAKIIIEKSDTTFTEIESVADTSFTSSTPSNHNELGGLQGGAANEYYHNTSAINTALTNATGTDDFVRETSPTLVTPALGTPASGDLTNCTNVPAGNFDTIGDPSGNGVIAFGTTTQDITLGNDGIFRIGAIGLADYFYFKELDGDYIFGMVDGASDGNIFIQTGTQTITDEAIAIQTGLLDADYFSLAAYDVNGTAYQSLLRPVASNTPHLELGPATNFIKVSQTGAMTFEGTADIDLPANSVDSADLNSITLSPIILAEPDQLQPIDDAWPLYHFIAETYPSGVTITAIHISTSATCTDALNFEEWSNNGTAWSTDSTVEAITLSGTHTEDDGTLADSSIAADAWLYVDLPASPTDIAYYSITISFTAN